MAASRWRMVMREGAGWEVECRDVGPTKSGIIAGTFDTVWFVYKNSGSTRCCDDPQRSCVER